MTHEQKTYRIGDATVTRVQEIILADFKPSGLFRDWDAKLVADHPDWLTQEANDEESIDLAQERLAVSVHSWIIRESGRTTIIDTGIGSGRDRPHAPYFHQLQTPFLERLQNVGIAPEDVDYVLLTHQHVDHVGWNTRLHDGRWVPTFPKARYIFARAERDYFTDPDNLNDRNRTSFQIQKDCIDPIIAAGLADMIEIDGSAPIDGFEFHPTPGHSPAHASILFRSGGEEALFAGDVMHHPVQVYQPQWNAVFDAAAEAARQSRLWALNFAADRGVTFFSSHFPGSSAGHVRRDGAGFRWQFR